MPFHGYAANNSWVTVWRRTGTGEGGRPVVSTVAEEIECNFEERAREDSAPDSGAVSVDAVISGLPPPPWDLPVGSAVARGRVEDQLRTGQLPRFDVFKVLALRKDTDWRGRDWEVEADLERGADVIWQQAGTA